jgi:hypothetical protein
MNSRPIENQYREGTMKENLERGESEKEREIEQVEQLFD